LDGIFAKDRAKTRGVICTIIARNKEDMILRLISLYEEHYGPYVLGEDIIETLTGLYIFDKTLTDKIEVTDRIKLLRSIDIVPYISGDPSAGGGICSPEPFDPNEIESWKNTREYYQIDDDVFNKVVRVIEQDERLR